MPRPDVLRQTSPEASARARAAPPRGCLLSNGKLAVLLTAEGTGYSACGATALTRWAGDLVADRDGYFIYLRDLEDGTAWSAGRQPVPGGPADYRTVWRPGRYEIARRDHGIESRLEACVTPGAALEIRRVMLHNHSRRTRRIEITSYAEVVLDRPAAFAAHPAFSKLFLQTELVPELAALLVRRRPRSRDERHPWLVHAMPGTGRLQHETDRLRFIGRGRSKAAPLALASRARLSGTTGNVLDPIVSLRRVMRLEPDQAASIHMLLGAADDRELALALVSGHGVDGAFELAEREARAEIERAGLDTGAAERAQAQALALHARDGNAAGAEAPFDLDLLYRTWSPVAAPAPRVALVPPPVPPGPRPAARRRSGPGARRRRGKEERLSSFNGYGGFSKDGREYVVRLGHRPGAGLRLPPSPWINVLANEEFGCLVSETGAGATWSGNSREHRLTPWRNDALLDPHGEALYVRDEETGEFWSPLPGPAPAAADYEMRHGFGYSRCRHASHGLDHDTWLFVPRRDPVKIARLRLTNRSSRPRRLSLFAYQELVLGADPRAPAGSVVTEHDRAASVLLARRPGRGPFADRVAFAAAVVPGGARALRAADDRAAFVGTRGLESPAAIRERRTLDGSADADLERCFAQQVVLDVAPGATAECAFLFGEEIDAGEARALVRRYRLRDAVCAALDDVREFWAELVSRVRITTPRPAIDLMVNGWLAYQTLACRLWARSAFYQSGGAFGYRDQLQDAVALTMLEPALARRQILLHAAHQFVEGDALHWWHPPLGRGIRTRFADDRLWLPYLTMTYIETTGDWNVLDARARFVTARPLDPGEDEAYLEPADSGAPGDVFDHCCRAIDCSLAVGPHRLPLFGTGDWNDGMNRVGREGRGESVWMGFFLHAILDGFLPACARRGERARLRRYRAHRDRLRAALEAHGWDGGWYRRGYYDDGAPLGSRRSDECRIDALAQAWSVISRAATPERARRALAAVEHELVDEPSGLIRLLAPPFDRTERDPGYIKGYVPGVRENGGQYTHAALWVVRALAELGRRDRAARLLEMLSPVSHARTRRQAETYRVEPYVIAADVYGAAPHVGRGGWTWYTGSAGWMLRVTLESVLGVRWERGETLVIDPRVPDEWPGFRVAWRVPGGTTTYDVIVRNPRRRARRVVEARIDGAPAPVAAGAARIPIARDGRTHRADVVLG